MDRDGHAEGILGAPLQHVQAAFDKQLVQHCAQLRTRPGHCPNRHSQPANTDGVQQKSPCHTAKRFKPIPEGEPRQQSRSPNVGQRDTIREPPRNSATAHGRASLPEKIVRRGACGLTAVVQRISQRPDHGPGAETECSQ